MKNRLRRAGFVVVLRQANRLVGISHEGRAALVLDDLVAGDVVVMDGIPVNLAGRQTALRCRRLILVSSHLRDDHARAVHRQYRVTSISSWLPPRDHLDALRMRAVLRHEIQAWLERVDQVDGAAG